MCIIGRRGNSTNMTIAIQPCILKVNAQYESQDIVENPLPGQQAAADGYGDEGGESFPDEVGQGTSCPAVQGGKDDALPARAGGHRHRSGRHVHCPMIH